MTEKEKELQNKIAMIEVSLSSLQKTFNDYHESIVNLKEELKYLEDNPEIDFENIFRR